MSDPVKPKVTEDDVFNALRAYDINGHRIKKVLNWYVCQECDLQRAEDNLEAFSAFTCDMWKWEQAEDYTEDYTTPDWGDDWEYRDDKTEGRR